MGLRNSWRTSAAATFRTQGNRGSGEGDSSGGPKPQRQYGNQWPTLIIEAGYSQTLQGLRRVMRWWFSASDHAVKIVLLIKMDIARQEIILEKWQEVQALPRQGATTTRAAAILEPNCLQSIHIGSPILYHVTRGSLRLGFSELFLRAPGTGERDIIIDVAHLQWIANEVWDR